jgi:hypothetical protein
MITDFIFEVIKLQRIQTLVITSVKVLLLALFRPPVTNITTGRKGGKVLFVDG